MEYKQRKHIKKILIFSLFFLNNLYPICGTDDCHIAGQVSQTIPNRFAAIKKDIELLQSVAATMRNEYTEVSKKTGEVETQYKEALQIINKLNKVLGIS